MASRILEAFNESNAVPIRLSKIVTERSEWRTYDAKMCPFPELDEDDLRSLCFGTKESFDKTMLTAFFLGSYQVKQATSYIIEHLTPSALNHEEFEFIVELCPKYNDLVRARFASRHSSRKTYITIVQYNTRSIVHPITEWHCICKAGWRDVGCCVHVTALLWHLGVCRAEINQNIHPLSASQIFAAISDSVQLSDVEESDDENNNIDDNS